jgi:hypothetical protein
MDLEVAQREGNQPERNSVNRRVKRVAVCAMATAGVFTMAILVAGRDHPERYQASDRLWSALPDAQLVEFFHHA